MQPLKSWLHCLAVTVLLVLFAASSWACEDITWDTGGGRSDRGERDQAPRKRPAYGEGVRCFDTFGKFKRAMEKEGWKKRLGYQWHHIVAQHAGNKKQFEERNLHCTDNLVYLSKEDHEKLNGLYSRTNPKTGKSLRDFLRDKEFRTQYDYGCEAMKDQNVTYTEPVCGQ